MVSILDDVSGPGFLHSICVGAPALPSPLFTESLRSRLKSLAAERDVRVSELATLLSTFEAVVWSVHHLEKAGVPPEEFQVFPDPRELLTNEGDMTTGEAVEILREFLEMSAQGEAR